MEDGKGDLLGAYASFPKGMKRVKVRTGTSFVSTKPARANLDVEVPDGATFESVVDGVKDSWLDTLGRVTIEGINKTDAAHNQRTVFYTCLFHALQYPNDFSEPMPVSKGHTRTFYSGYTESVHIAPGSYYQSWSVRDTYRAVLSLLTIFAPSRANEMMRSLVPSINGRVGRQCGPTSQRLIS